MLVTALRGSRTHILLLRCSIQLSYIYRFTGTGCAHAGVCLGQAISAIPGCLMITGAGQARAGLRQGQEVISIPDKLV